jgi:AhpD family alkylhydroperoxidase
VIIFWHASLEACRPPSIPRNLRARQGRQFFLSMWPRDWAAALLLSHFAWQKTTGATRKIKNSIFVSQLTRLLRLTEYDRRIVRGPKIIERFIMSKTARIPFFTLAPAPSKALINLSIAVKKSSLGERLVELVNLRVSQVNGCGLCVDMHWGELIKQGADPRHLNSIAGWRESPFFSARERAAFGWADAVNALPLRDDTDIAFGELREHFNETEIAELSYGIAAIRGWNVLNVSLRNQIPG